MSDDDFQPPDDEFERQIDHAFVTETLAELARARDPLEAKRLRDDLYLHCSSPLIRFCRRVGPSLWVGFNKEDSLDVIHCVFMHLETRKVRYQANKIVKKIRKGKKTKGEPQPAKGYTYLCQMVKNEIIDWARKSSCRLPENVSIDTVDIDYISKSLSSVIELACSEDGASVVDANDFLEYARLCYNELYNSLDDELQQRIVHEHYVNRKKVAQITREVQDEDTKISRKQVSRRLNQFANQLPEEVEEFLCQKPKKVTEKAARKTKTKDT